MDIDEQVKYWLELAEMDIPVMVHLFESGDYSYSLYIGHLILEKTLKAHFVKIKKDTPPRTHDLQRLLASTGLAVNDEQRNFLSYVTSFNIEARYPDEKLAFYKICTKEFAKTNIDKIKDIYSWLKSLI